MRTDNLGALVAALRELRIQFVGESRDAELGLLLVKERRGDKSRGAKAE